jgi:hypothetical protein
MSCRDQQIAENRLTGEGNDFYSRAEEEERRASGTELEADYLMQNRDCELLLQLMNALIYFH